MVFKDSLRKFKYNAYDSLVEDRDTKTPKSNLIDSANTEGTNADSRNSIRLKIFMFFVVTVNVFCGICYSEQAPFFPEEASKKKISISLTGWIFAAPSLSRILFTPLLGYFMSSIGVRFMAISGLLALGTCVFLFGFLNDGPNGWIFFGLCMLCRAVEGTGWAAFITARYVIITMTFPKYVGTLNGFSDGCFQIGAMVGPPVGGALYNYGGFAFVFCVSGITVIAYTLLAIPVFPEIKDIDRHGNRLRLTLNQYVALFPGAFTIVISNYVFIFTEPILEPFLTQFNLSSVMIGLMFMIVAVTSVVGIYVSSWIADRKPWQLHCILVGLIISCLAYLLMGPAPFLPFIPLKLWIVIIALVLQGMGAGTSYGPAYVFLLRSGKKAGMQDNVDTLGIISVVQNMAVAVGMFTGPIAAGTLTDYFGFEWATCCVSGLCILDMLLLLGAECKDKMTSKDKDVNNN